MGDKKQEMIDELSNYLTFPQSSIIALGSPNSSVYDEKTTGVSSLTEDIENRSSAKVEYVCTVCEEKFYLVDDMIQHMTVHSQKSIPSSLSRTTSLQQSGVDFCPSFEQNNSHFPAEEVSAECVQVLLDHDVESDGNIASTSDIFIMADDDVLDNTNEYIVTTSKTKMFDEDWLLDEELMDWLYISKDKMKGQCNVCSCSLQPDLHKLKQHNQSPLHQNLLKLLNKTNIQPSHQKIESYEPNIEISWQDADAELDSQDQVMVRAGLSKEGSVVVFGFQTKSKKKFQRYVRYWDSDILPLFESYCSSFETICGADNEEEDKTMRFKESWSYNVDFQPWLSRTKNPQMAFCGVCRTIIKAKLNLIEEHSSSEIHSFYNDNINLRPLSFEQYKNIKFTTDNYPKIYSSAEVQSEALLARIESFPNTEHHQDKEFKNIWLKNEEFKPWLSHSYKSLALCTVCKVSIPAQMLMLRNHMNSNIHIKMFNEHCPSSIDSSFNHQINIHEEKDEDPPPKDPIGTVKRRTFLLSWLKNDDLKDWLRPTNDETRAKCVACDKEMNAEIASIKKHLISKSHEKNYNSKGKNGVQMDSFEFPESINFSSAIIKQESPEKPTTDLTDHVQCTLITYFPNDSDVTKTVIKPEQDTLSSICGEESSVIDSDFSSKLFPDDSELKNYKPSHNDDSFSCLFCNYLALNKEELEEHWNNCSKIQSHVKNEIDENHKKLNNKIVKKKRKRTPRLKCPKCDYQTQKLIDLKIHKLQHIIPCTKCNYNAYSILDLSKHVNDNHNTINDSNKTFSCNECPYSCDEEILIEKHSLNVHGVHFQVKAYKCLICHKNYKNSASLNEHMKRKHPDSLMQCSRCDFYHYCEQTWARHMRDHEKADFGQLDNNLDLPHFDNLTRVGDDEIFMEFDDNVDGDKTLHVQYVDDQKLKITELTENCEEDSPQTLILKRSINQDDKNGPHFEQLVLEVEGKDQSHSKIETDQMVVGPEYEIHFCSVCDFTFSNEKDYQTHLTIKHPRKFHHVCPSCSYRYSDKSKLNRHLRSHCLTQLKCDQCSFVTPYRKAMTRHLRSIHLATEAYQCNQCNRKFFTQENMIKHMGVHNNEKNYSCDKCSFSAASIPGLRYHIKQNHKKDEIYKCTQCIYQTFHKVAIDRHIKKHSGIKHLKCKVCDFATYDYTSLKRHMFRHGGGEKKFHCTQCDYKFYQKTTLVRHMKTHSGSLPFHCMYCPFRSNYKGTLTKHIQSTHRHEGTLIVDQMSTIEVNI